MVYRVGNGEHGRYLMRHRTFRLDRLSRFVAMAVLGAAAVAIVLAGRVAADETFAVPLEAAMPQLITACNRAVEGGIGKRRAMRACETLAKANRLGFADPAASSAYQRYQGNSERWQACQRSQLPIPAEQRLGCPR
jgi:hypothetical protein